MASTVDLTALRDEFPMTAEWSYLDHAAYGPWPIQTVQAVQQWASGFASPSGFFTEERAAIPGEAARLVAALAGTTGDQVAWVANLAEGMNLLGHGIDWRAGDNVLVPREEFPSVVYPFLNLSRYGVETRFIEKDENGRTDIARIEAALDDRTRAVALSHVEYMDGFRNDLAALGSLCRARGVELFVDATQSLGAQPIDLRNSGVTAVAAHGYKWLMAGFGIGVVVFAPGAVERIKVTYAGRLSVKSGFEDHDYTLNWQDGAARYQTGGLNQLGITALHASLALRAGLAPEQVREHTLGLHDRLIEGLRALNYNIASDLRPEHRSQILAFSSGSHERDGELVEHLRQHDVAVTLRGRGVRVSPYFYNNESDIDRMLEVLPPR